MTREWGVKEPQSNELICEECGETFLWKARGRPKFCEKHRTGAKKTGKTKITVCMRCGNEFEQIRKGSGSGREKACSNCREIIKEAKNDRTKAVLISRALQNNSAMVGAMEASLEMIGRTVDANDDPFELVCKDLELTMESILLDLQRNEVVYASSVTEAPHRQPFNLQRVDIMIEKKRGSKQVQEMVEQMKMSHEFYRDKNGRVARNRQRFNSKTHKLIDESWMMDRFTAIT